MLLNRCLKSLLLLSLIVSFSACEEDGSANSDTDFGVFKVIDDNTLEMDGDITSASLSDFNELINRYPDIKQINIREVPGSADDEINLQVSLAVHERNIAIHLMDNGLIASGGVDFFLAGTTRTKGSNTQVGVHSWSAGSKEATDFPRGDANHQPYIDYYKSVGFTQMEAEAFYYFTINAAPATEIYWMTEAEIEQFRILKP